jgi:alpha-amylase/alpha-mannosidase (GH57 family)
MDRYVCIHGHFYQPPRENAWLEAVELQDSAYPYHDWNEKITAECYGPNATSRILDPAGRIIRLVNNYSRISFNFGPTLLTWMEKNSQDSYAAILEADRQSQQNFSGHGSALAQAYNHMILPLANRSDKETQVVWGIRDFEFRFGHKPEGMWLPETAVDTETLEIVAEHGILFTILAPSQGSRVRPIDSDEWQDVSGGKIDPTMTYRLTLPSGRSMTLFFYDGPISRAVAFEGLLNDGEAFANRVLGAFSEDRDWAQIAHIATDGESYGHHHRNGDMALAYALDYIESHNLARLTNYGEYLEMHPPTHEVEIFENTSWSCSHGIERWRSDCGCNAGGYPAWSQAWRGPLRDALDWLRDTLAPGYQIAAGALVKDPWAARNDYIEVLLDRSSESIERFFSQHAIRDLNESDKIRLLKLLELQRHTMLMYTSCGWFFDELSGIETVQVLQYAGRAVQLAQDLFGGNIESQFLELLEAARSNIAEHSDGRHIYEKWVKPAVLDLTKVAAHYAISSVFDEYPPEGPVFAYDVVQEDFQVARAGRANLTVGRARFTSRTTMESRTMTFGVLYMGDHNLNCGVTDCNDEENCGSLIPELSEAFFRADFPDNIRLMDRHFGASTYSLTSLFRDAQRKVTNLILEPMIAEAKSAYGRLYEHHAVLIHFLQGSGMPIPRPLHAAAEFVLNDRLRQALEETPHDPQSIEALLEETLLAGVSPETTTLEFALRKSLERMADRWWEDPGKIEELQNLQTGVTLVESMPFVVNLRTVQNICYKIMQNVYPEYQRRAYQGDEPARQWVETIRGLAEKLWITVQ